MPCGIFEGGVFACKRPSAILREVLLLAKGPSMMLKEVLLLIKVSLDCEGGTFAWQKMT